MDNVTKLGATSLKRRVHNVGIVKQGRNYEDLER